MSRSGKIPTPRSRLALALFLLAGLMPLAALGRPVDGDGAGRIFFNFDNDVFSGTDRVYTGGLRLGWLSGDMAGGENPGLRWLPFIRGNGYSNRVSVILGQMAFTPYDLDRADPIDGDQPYGGYLFLGLGVYSLSRGSSHAFGFDVGVIGPHSFAGRVQRFIHLVFGFSEPLGWKNQIRDELALQAAYEFRQSAFRIAGARGFGFEIIPGLGAGVGNVYVYGGASVELRLGWNLPSHPGFLRLVPGGRGPVRVLSRDPSGLHFFVSASGQLNFRNIFLDGSTARGNSRVEKEPLTGDVAVGIDFSLGRWCFTYAHVFWTKRYISEPRSHSYGSLILSLSL